MLPSPGPGQGLQGPPWSPATCARESASPQWTPSPLGRHLSPRHRMTDSGKNERNYLLPFRHTILHDTLRYSQCARTACRHLGPPRPGNSPRTAVSLGANPCTESSLDGASPQAPSHASPVPLKEHAPARVSPSLETPASLQPSAPRYVVLRICLGHGLGTQPLP